MFWLIFFIAITMAVDTLGITAISAVLSQFIAYIPQIIAAILILVLATLLANFVAGIVRGATGSGVAGSVAQYGIIVFAAFAALTQMGIAPELIAPTFLILLGAVALAAALAFGLGARASPAGWSSRATRRATRPSGRSASTSSSRTAAPPPGTRRATARGPPPAARARGAPSRRHQEKRAAAGGIGRAPS